MKHKNNIVNIIALLFILLFVYTGASKFLDFEYFKLTIEQAKLLKPYASIIHWVIPITEIAIALMLATSKFRLAGLYASFVLMLSFTIYVAAILQFSEQLPCSCGGIIQQMNWSQHLVFNICFTLLALIAMLLERKRENKQQEIAQAIYSGNN